MYDTYKCVRDYNGRFHKDGKYMGYYDGDDATFTIYDAFGGGVIVDETDFYEHFEEVEDQ